mmetsp:Transcript_45904/g.146527  ORF Transcript_45904/g.146527 Transcript_45904/m.146527 type:complete len:455 (-) Transcript_45904:37-1401(-)
MGQLRSDEPDQHLGAVDEEPDAEYSRCEGEVLPGRNGRESYEDDGEEREVPEHHANTIIVQLVTQNASEEAAEEAAQLEGGEHTSGLGRGGHSLDILQVVDGPRGESLADGVDEEIGEGECPDGLVAEHILDQDILGRGLVLRGGGGGCALGRLLLLGGVGRGQADVLRLVPDAEEEDDARCDCHQSGDHHSPAPAPRVSNGADHDGGQEASDVVRRTPERPPRAAGLSRVPLGKKLSAGGGAEALKEAVGGPQEGEAGEGVLGPHGQVEATRREEPNRKDQAGTKHVRTDARRKLGEAIHDREDRCDAANLLECEPHVALDHGRREGEGEPVEVEDDVARPEEGEYEVPPPHDGLLLSLRDLACIPCRCPRDQRGLAGIRRATGWHGGREGDACGANASAPDRAAAGSGGGARHGGRRSLANPSMPSDRGRGPRGAHPHGRACVHGVQDDALH